MLLPNQWVLLMGCCAINSLLLLRLTHLGELLLRILKITCIPTALALLWLVVVIHIMLLIQQLLKITQILNIIQINMLHLTILSRYNLPILQKLMLIYLQHLAFIWQNYLYHLVL
jgi:hypothetical protein